MNCKHPDDLIEWDGEGFDTDANGYFGTCKCGARIVEEYTHTRTVVIDKETGDILEELPESRNNA